MYNTFYNCFPKAYFFSLMKYNNFDRDKNPKPQAAKRNEMSPPMI